MARRAAADEGMAVDPFRGVDRLRACQRASSGAQEAIENPKGSKASAANAARSPYGELTLDSFAKH